jgi:hypothetical protein
VDIKRKNSALVIGNGTSRKQFDLNSLNEIFVTYGCNALYRDFIPDHLISVDVYMIHEILQNQIQHKTQLHIQGHSQFDNHVERSNYNIIHYGYKEGLDSGNSAILVACQQNYKNIYIIGMDYSVDNVYSNTRNYNSHSHKSLPPVWQTRLNRIIDRYPEVNFIRVNGNNFVPDIDKTNFKNITIEQFKEICNELQNG